MNTHLHSLAALCMARTLAPFFVCRASLCAAFGLLAALSFGPHPARAAVTEAWVQRYDYGLFFDSIHWPFKIVRDAAGNIIVAGSNGHDMLTIKYSGADGSELWEKRYRGPGPSNSFDYALAVAVDSSGNVVVIGSSDDSDYYTAKYAAADGALLWEKRYHGPSNFLDWDGEDVAGSVTVDGSGNVVTTGSSTGGEHIYDYYTAKYAAADGALLWEQRYRGPAGYNVAHAVAVDSGENVVVTGFSHSATTVDEFGNWTNTDFYTAKYAAADGALLWEKRYNGPGNLYDYAQAVAVDSSGNVIVTGYSYGSGSVADYYTAKYAAADGALLWEKRYNGPANGYDIANALAVDGSGNVVVTGTSYDVNPANPNYYTAKYAAADGALLWEKRSLGYAGAVAVDSSGNVVMTGASDGDYYTAKYAAAGGTLLWEKRYSGPDNGNDLATSLALGPNGMVAITGSSSGGYATATVVYREIPPPLSFAAWAANSGLSGAASAADADPDSDGLPNGTEYVLGGNPTVPSTSGSPAATTSGGNIILTFPRDDESETPDVTLTVETGTDLMSWPAVFHIGPNTAASSPGVSITENEAAPDTITVTIAQGADLAKFARLKVTVAR